MRATWSGGNRLALALFLGALSLTAAAGWSRGAGWMSPEPPLRVPGTRADSASVPRIRIASSAEALNRIALGVVARDPFREERTRPAERFRARGSENLPEAQTTVPSPPPPPVPARPPVPRFRLAGLVASGAGKGLAALELPGSPPRVVSVGDSIAGFRLVSVSTAEARLQGRDTTLVLHISATQ